ncbi:hypothetical protein PN462_15925 [Spirulina sp. CS-785/01]|uniref:hypothetical protein n=1 Tax=Spirulina sp. CS-785/01 TaxID=3021716 RepID=UPI002330A7FB|nr:hypothetical protein [Spirulina sp. CS-785/01]MDB9314600.1 hypothetical protein [Spirulina sp. CS-785/01]
MASISNMSISPIGDELTIRQKLYEIYGKIYTVEALTPQEQHLLEYIAQKDTLGPEGQDILRRIRYVLKRKQRQNRQQAA